MSESTRDLVIEARAEIAHLKTGLETQGKKVDEMHALMLQAKGASKLARWARPLITAVIAIGAAQLGIHLPLGGRH